MADYRASRMPDGPDHSGAPRVVGPDGAEPVLYYAAAFLIIALLAAALGFGGIAGSATMIARILFLVFVALAGLSLLARESRVREID
jgi:uncharacterized membrane protein YtjA (UPF0391 family)